MREGWLVNYHFQQVVQFKLETSTTSVEWASVRTFEWKPPYQPKPLTSRRMLRDNALMTWSNLLKRGWRRCHPPCQS